MIAVNLATHDTAASMSSSTSNFDGYHSWDCLLYSCN